jgi:hypothetical protein
VQPEQGGEAERLRRLRPVKPLAGDGRGDRAIVGALQRVRDWDRGNRTLVALERRKQRRDRVGRQERPRRVVHEHHVRRLRGQCLEPGAHAVLARRTPRHDGQVLEPGQRRTKRLRVAHRLQQRDMRQQPFRRPADDRLAGTLVELLRPVGPETEP